LLQVMLAEFLGLPQVTNVSKIPSAEAGQLVVAEGA